MVAMFQKMFQKKSTGFYLILVSLVFMLPLVISGYLIYTAMYIGIWIMLACGVNLITGYMGYPTISHAVFYGVGAYTSALLTLRMGLPPWLGIIAALILAGIIGFLVGIPLLRLREMHFAIGTLAFGLVAYGLFVNLRDVTGGMAGLSGIPRLFQSDVSYYYLVVILVLLIILFVKKLSESHFGSALIAIREDEELTKHIGFDVKRYKILTFAIAAAIAGLAGAVHIHYLGFITSEYFTFHVSFFLLAAVLIGGAGTLLGPIIGAVIVVGIPELLRPLMEWRPLFLGITLLVIILIIPEGIVGKIKEIIKRKGGVIGETSLH